MRRSSVQTRQPHWLSKSVDSTATAQAQMQPMQPMQQQWMQPQLMQPQPMQPQLMQPQWMQPQWMQPPQVTRLNDQPPPPPPPASSHLRGALTAVRHSVSADPQCPFLLSTLAPYSLVFALGSTPPASNLRYLYDQRMVATAVVLYVVCCMLYVVSCMLHVACSSPQQATASTSACSPLLSCRASMRTPQRRCKHHTRLTRR